MTLPEVVEDDPEHPTFKLLAARLYNSGLKVKTLTRTLGVPYTTLKRWGDVLKSGDTQRLLRMLTGRKHPRKLTPEVRSFVRHRFAHIYPLNPYNYSQCIRDELQDVFGISVSAESLRLLFNDCKQHFTTPENDVARMPTLVIQEQGYCKLDTQKKSLMDGTKFTARNLFYVMLEPFREAYNNYRDDHVLFRHLTRAHGLIRQHEDRVEVFLLTEAKFPPKVVKIIEEILAELNTNGLTMPDGSGKALELKLFQQEQVAFVVNGRKSRQAVNSG